MQLSSFPHAIATASYELLKIGAEIRIVRSAILEIEAEIDSCIAFGEFKNDSQRKAAKSQLLKENNFYDQRCSQLQVLTDKYAHEEIGLNLLKNNFAIAKLEARERIAKLETLAA